MKLFWQTIAKWIANENDYDPAVQYPDKVDWLRALPFILVNLSCFLVFWVGVSWVACLTALGLYYFRIFAIGAFYHRYFSHKTYQTSRFAQFMFAVFAASAAQRGPLWWSSHHRQHHMCSDEPNDAHSPVQHGFWWSHMGWFLSKKYYYYNPDRVKDLARFPELRFLDRYDSLIPALLFTTLFVVGFLLQHYAPSLHTSALQMVIWGFSISTIALFHTTVTINSLSHVIGFKRFETKDNSRNHFLLGFFTMGEGWHNNHHHYPATARQGFWWWEIDMTYYILKFLEVLGIVWNVKGVPKSVLQKDLVNE